MNKWQRLHIAVLDAVVDHGPSTVDEIHDRIWKLDGHFSKTRVGVACEVLEDFGALIRYPVRRRRQTIVLFQANTTQPQKLRAVWRGEPFSVPGADVSCIVPGTTSNAQ